MATEITLRGPSINGTASFRAKPIARGQEPSWDLPALNKIEQMTKDANGQVLHLGAVVRSVLPIFSSHKAGDVPPGTLLRVTGKVSAAFVLEDAAGGVHVARGLRLELVSQGDEATPATIAVPNVSRREASVRGGYNSHVKTKVPSKRSDSHNKQDG